MTPEEFFALPAPMALRVLWDCLDEGTTAALLAKEKPKLPLPPKFDMPIYRKGGFQYASETDMEGLRYWHKRAVESAARGGEWASKDAKKAKDLERWIAWRDCFGETPWSGERNNQMVTAGPPSARPAVYEKSGGGRPATPPPDDDVDVEGDIPF